MFDYAHYKINLLLTINLIFFSASLHQILMIVWVLGLFWFGWLTVHPDLTYDQRMNVRLTSTRPSSEIYPYLDSHHYWSAAYPSARGIKFPPRSSRDIHYLGTDNGEADLERPKLFHSFAGDVTSSQSGRRRNLTVCIESMILWGILVTCRIVTILVVRIKARPPLKSFYSDNKYIIFPDPNNTNESEVSHSWNIAGMLQTENQNPK